MNPRDHRLALIHMSDEASSITNSIEDFIEETEFMLFGAQSVFGPGEYSRLIGRLRGHVLDLAESLDQLRSQVTEVAE
ncbi:MAG: hypothetical protein R2770_09210 [Acidimicrobiales bacterium]